MNGINKISGELYHLVYHSVYGIRASSLRLTNTYGPRQLIRHNRQGFIGWFVRKAVLGEEIQLFGDGQQKRDFNHVDDVVDAFLRAGAHAHAADGRVFNLGGGAARRRLLELAQLLVELAGQGSYRARALPRGAQADRHRRLLRRHEPGRAPPWAGRRRSALREGLARDPRLLPRAQGALPVTRPGAGVPFVDFRAHVAAHRGEIDAAIARVLDSGWFILGPEGEAFERELAQALGAQRRGRGGQRHRGPAARASWPSAWARATRS